MPRPPRPRRVVITRWYVGKGKDRRRAAAAAPGAYRVKEKSKTWYAKVEGRRVCLKTEDEGEAWTRLRKLLRRLNDERAGVVAPRDESAPRPLADYLDDYLAHLRAKGDGKRHVAYVKCRLTAVLSEGGFARLADLTPDRLGALLARWRETPGKGRGRRTGTRRRGATTQVGMGAQTCNHHIAAASAFAAWVGRRLKQPNPLAGMPRLKVSTDRRHVRRTLTDDEFARLLEATRAGPTRRGLNGPDRAMLYVVAAYTGLRASTLGSLSAESVSLTADPPTLTVHPRADKGGRERVFPLHAAVAAQLAAWLKGRTGKLWPGAWVKDCRASYLIKADLAAAGIPRIAKGKVFDFHALRMQFITNLAKAGVPLVAAQKLAGHSSPTLTANYYVHLETQDLAKEVNKLPPPPRPKGQP